MAAILAVFELDERTVANWMHRAGQYAETFHNQHVKPVDLQQMQVDEIRLKMQHQIVWIAMTMSVGSRLWMGAVCQVSRDKKFAKQIITCVYNWAKQVPLIIAFDGWKTYPATCLKVFRELVLTSKIGAPRKQPWRCLSIVQLVKQEVQKWVMHRWVVYGSCNATCYFLNVTFRTHLAAFIRRTRCPARQLQTVDERVFLVGCLYNFCWFHASLGKRTPAMAAGLGDHHQFLEEFLWKRLLPHFASTV